MKNLKHLAIITTITVVTAIAVIACVSPAWAQSVVSGMQGAIDTGQFRPVRLDSSTHAMIVTPYDHHETHEGNHFIFTDVNDDMDDAETMTYLIVTPNTTKWANFVYDVTGSLHTHVEVFEDCNHSAGATQTVYNSNRNSATANTTLVKASADDNSNGTRIEYRSFGLDAGGGVNRVYGGGDARGDNEFILKQNTTYLIKVTSLTDNNVVSLKLAWYEHTDKD